MDARTKLLISFTRSFLIITSIFSLFDYAENPNFLKIDNEYKNYKFLLFTKISLFLTIISAISGVIHRLTGNYHFIENFFLPISFTFEFIVTTVYWALFMIDKRLIVDKNTLKPGCETPLLSTFSSHVFPLILAYIDRIDFKMKPKDYHIIFFILFGVFYYICVTLYASYFGTYIYPFLDKLGCYQRISFFIGIAIVGICFYKLQIRLVDKQ
ncbi:hypothetical protein GINT2_000648 [Glugoides intestinalis]